MATTTLSTTTHQTMSPSINNNLSGTQVMHYPIHTQTPFMLPCQYRNGEKPPGDPNTTSVNLPDILFRRNKVETNTECTIKQTINQTDELHPTTIY